MSKPTKPGWYWVKRTYGADEWVPCCLTNLGHPWLFGDVEEHDDSVIREWGPRIPAPEEPSA